MLEALRAGKRQIETITILESARPDRLKALLELAREKGVPVHRVPRLDLDRSLGDVRHQGVVARIAAARYADPDVLLDQLESKIGTADPPLVVGPRRDRGSTQHGFDFAHCRVSLALMEFLSPSDAPWV